MHAIAACTNTALHRSLAGNGLLKPRVFPFRREAERHSPPRTPHLPKAVSRHTRQVHRCVAWPPKMNAWDCFEMLSPVAATEST